MSTTAKDSGKELKEFLEKTYRLFSPVPVLRS